MVNSFPIATPTDLQSLFPVLCFLWKPDDQPRNDTQGKKYGGCTGDVTTQRPVWKITYNGLFYPVQQKPAVQAEHGPHKIGRDGCFVRGTGDVTGIGIDIIR